jgi:hypothetical protein
MKLLELAAIAVDPNFFDESKLVDSTIMSDFDNFDVI